jgi:hypothetical protein
MVEKVRQWVSFTLGADHKLTTETTENTEENHNCFLPFPVVSVVSAVQNSLSMTAGKLHPCSGLVRGEVNETLQNSRHSG